MKKGVLYAVLLIGAILVPTQPKELGTMVPVETIIIKEMDGAVAVETDTGDCGMGSTLQLAMEDLMNRAVGAIDLDTTAYLIVNKGAEELIGKMNQYIKGSVRVCITEEPVEIQSATEYMRHHRPATRLRDWNGSHGIEILAILGDRYLLKEK